MKSERNRRSLKETGALSLQPRRRQAAKTGAELRKRAMTGEVLRKQEAVTGEGLRKQEAATGVALRKVEAEIGAEIQAVGTGEARLDKATGEANLQNLRHRQAEEEEEEGEDEEDVEVALEKAEAEGVTRAAKRATLPKTALQSQSEAQ